MNNSITTNTSNDIASSYVSITSIDSLRKNSTDTIIENPYNKDLFNEEISVLKEILENDHFESGIESNFERFIRKTLKNKNLDIKNLINVLMLQGFSNDLMLLALLKTMSHFAYYELYPQSMTIAMACLSHKNVEIKECVIGCFENWATHECLGILKTFSKFEEIWLNEYITQVISDLELELKD